MKKTLSLLFIAAALSACAYAVVKPPAQLVESPCALPNPQPGIYCDGYRINP